MGKRPIYLDYNATTSLIEPVRETIREIMDEFGNPSSAHWYGLRAREIVESAREKVAALVNCCPEEVIFTSSGSESNNMALKGVAFRCKKGRIITSVIEHPSVLEACKFLKNLGFEIRYVGVNQYGIINPADVIKSISSDTILISIMLANNEVGTIQPIEEIAGVASEYGIPFHTDASQAVGKIKVDVQKLGVSLLTISGHKIYAPKGVGVLVVKKGVEIEPLIHGGGQEFGLRSGTENLLEIAAIGAAAEYLQENIENIYGKLFSLKERFWDALKKELSDVDINGHFEKSLPNTLNVYFPHVNSALLLDDVKEISASAGAACHSGQETPSYGLKAMGYSDERAYCSVRFSLGLPTTESDVEKAVSLISKSYKRLRYGFISSGREEKIRLTKFSHGLGCACKLSPAALEGIVKGFAGIGKPEVLVGCENFDDAGVYRVADDMALVSTVDFFPPVVDDPYIFGKIAVSNALSDIYAMGGNPIFAMNIVAFPVGRLPIGILEEILKGARDKAEEAGVVIIGGHTIEDIGLKYGLVVNGLINPRKVLRNNTPMIGDVLILTKPIGTGVLSVAMQKGFLDSKSEEALIETMVELNKKAAEVMKDYPVSACTDVTGFGLIGHLCEMVRDSRSAVVDYESIPLLPGVVRCVRLGALPGGTRRNRDSLSSMVFFEKGLSDIERVILFDAQTSGGLLFTVPPDCSESVLDQLREKGVKSASIIGYIVDERKHKVIVR